MSLRCNAALLAVFCFLASGCTGRAAATANAQAAEPGRVVASVDGITITWEEMDKEAGPRLVTIRQDEYEARRGALEEIIYGKLLAREAEHRGITNEALLKDEVDAKITPATAVEVNTAYEQNKLRFGSRPKPDVLREIQKALDDQRHRQREGEYRQELFSRAKITMNLEAPRAPVAIPASAPVVGNPAARVTLIEFSDYQCPFCHRAQNAVDQILKEYGDKVRFVHRELPIPGHARAFPAALAARCANEQGRFWDYHRNLMTVAGDFSDQDLEQRASGLGLDGKKLVECIGSGRFDSAVEDARKAARMIGVDSTPTFFVNGRMLTGAVPVEELQRVIDEELKQAGD